MSSLYYALYTDFLRNRITLHLDHCDEKVLNDDGLWWYIDQERMETDLFLSQYGVFSGITYKAGVSRPDETQIQNYYV